MDKNYNYTIIPVKIDCAFCGKEHYELVIEGHISQPHLCEDCWRKIMKEIEFEGADLNDSSRG